MGILKDNENPLKSKWIWYYGDFELYHNMKLHIRRKERNYTYPPFWRLDDCNKNVRFKKEFTLKKTEQFCVTANGMGFVQIGEVSNRRYEFGKIKLIKLDKDICMYYGETKEEAVTICDCYTYDCFTCEDVKKDLTSRAFRYLFIPEVKKKEVDFLVYYEYLPVKQIGAFQSSNETMNQIWNIALDTFWLNSREFYLDGIKRDRWVWSGDAYQSYFINKYVFFDEEIYKRTVLALRGKEPTEQHINTILDYSFYWIISIHDYYEMTGDKTFVSRIYPKMKSLMDFSLSRLDKDGFANKLNGDWIFIDWADMDKSGAVCAEQMLLLKSLESLVWCGNLLNQDTVFYEQKAKELKVNIHKYFWNEEKGAFIDCFESGRNHVTRHGNIFALLFDYVTERQRDLIIENVILNDKITRIKTPYFKFYELDAMCKIGHLEYVTKEILNYWGGMVSEGVTSFWEEYDETLDGKSQLDMYDRKYAKSLCHAWGASPIYLLGRYYLGVKSTSAGYETFTVEPKLSGFSKIEGIVPVKNGWVKIKREDTVLEVVTNRDGGTLIYNSKEWKLKKDTSLIISDYMD